MILEDMIYKKNLLGFFKDKLTSKGYTFKTLSYINGQIDLLNSLINSESANVLVGLLRKTNFRLFKGIEKGQDNLLEVVKYPEDWVLAEIKNNESEWVNNDSLIFSTERNMLVFTKKKINGFKYINNRWQ
jgi:hypothetical protein